MKLINVYVNVASSGEHKINFVRILASGEDLDLLIFDLPEPDPTLTYEAVI